jgi:hypothetical protein
VLLLLLLLLQVMTVIPFDSDEEAVAIANLICITLLPHQFNDHYSMRCRFAFHYSTGQCVVLDNVFWATAVAAAAAGDDCHPL